MATEDRTPPAGDPLRLAVQRYLTLLDEIRAKGTPPHADYWHQSIDAAQSAMRAALGPPDVIDHADLLRRYMRLVVQSEGSDLLKRAGTGGVDATFTPDELALLARLSEEAMR
jgi:hypothetical protein